jgi:type VI secretion system secreted protein Hcp
MKRISGLLSVKAVVLAFAVTMCASPGLGLAAGFLKFDGIKGETADNAPKGEIEIQSWSWGETNAGRSSGLPTGKRQHKPITITKVVDKASPILQQASTSGRSIPAMEVALPKKGGGAGEYMKYELKNVKVTSYSVSSSGGSVQTETFTLTYEETTAIPARISQSNTTDVEFIRERARN